MSKPTSQEIIEKGEYLEPGFDASSLLVAHLRAILQTHGVTFPTNANKTQLISLFKDNIASSASKFLQARETNAAIRSDGSEIMDAQTGEYLEAPKNTRKTSRKSIKEPRKSLAETSSTRDKSQKRHSHAAPKNGNETESEDERAKEIIRRKMEPSPERKARRVSQKWGTGDEASLWEDNNPFQSGRSGAEDSPAKPKPRKSAARKSVVAPPAEYSDERKSIFPTAGSLDLGFLGSPNSPSVRAYRQAESKGSGSQRASSFDKHGGPEDDSLAHIDVGEGGFPGVEGGYQVDLVAQRIAALSSGKSSNSVIPRSKSRVPWRSLFTSLAILTVTSILWLYKSDSAALGYCLPGTNTNDVVQQHQREIQEAIDCAAAAEKRATSDAPLDNDTAPCPPNILPRATTCTPCPPHAICNVHSISCEPAYMLQHSSISTIPLVDIIFNGLPYFGSVAFPRNCVPDLRRRKNVSAMARAIELKLATTRGNRLCQGIQLKGNENLDSVIFGMTPPEIRHELGKLKGKGNREIHNFEDIFNQALTELKGSGLLTVGYDPFGDEYLTTIREEMTYGCQAKLAILKAWFAWRGRLFASGVLLLLVFGFRSQMAQRAMEKRKVRHLVKEALDTLQQQEAKHYLDSVSYPTTGLSSLQLRDEVMQDEHSIARRVKLWEQVEKIVEGNSNVRANVEVMPSGDEARVWNWVGSGGKRIQFPSARDFM